LDYNDFKTGYKYADVWLLLWSGSEDPATWKYKRRSTVLGLWHQLKMEMWNYHTEMCSLQAECESTQQNDEVPF